MQTQIQLQGQITKFISRHGVGVIRAEDGRSYRFQRADVVSGTAPAVGAEVDFLVDTRRPVAIVMLSATPWTAFTGARN